MKFLSTLLAVAVSSSLASALTFTNRNFYNIKPGTAFNITWDDAAGPVTLTLLEGGTPGYLEPVATLATDVSVNYYSWTPSVDLTRDAYVVGFNDGSDQIYGFQFMLLAPITSTVVVSPTIASTAAPTAATWTYP